MRLSVYIDTREKLPYSFKGMKEIRKALPVGDYSIQNCMGEGGIIVERKTPEDMVNTLTNKNNLERFNKELSKMKKFKARFLIIESTPLDFMICCKKSRSSANSQSLLSFLLITCMRHKISPIFSGSRKYGNMITQMLLNSFYLERHQL